MKQCPKCVKATKTSERIETDKATNKSWLIIFCAKCGYNYEIEEYTDIVLSPQEEMNRYPEKSKSQFWPGL